MKNENILNGSKTETMDSDFANELIKEWIYWLSYESEEDKAKLEEIKAKKGSELTDIEKRILSDYKVERKILEALKRYSNKSSKDTNQELMQIFLNNNIEVLIVKKLCLRKINDATRFYENVKTKSLEEISDWLTRAEGTMAPTFRYTRLLLLKDGYKKITDGFTL